MCRLKLHWKIFILNLVRLQSMYMVLLNIFKIFDFEIFKIYEAMLYKKKTSTLMSFIRTLWRPHIYTYTIHIYILWQYFERSRKRLRAIGGTARDTTTTRCDDDVRRLKIYTRTIYSAIHITNLFNIQGYKIVCAAVTCFFFFFWSSTHKFVFWFICQFLNTNRHENFMN